MAEGAEGDPDGRRPARPQEARRDQRAPVREELAARGTQSRDDAAVPQHRERDPAGSEPFQHVAGVSDR